MRLFFGVPLAVPLQREAAGVTSRLSAGVSDRAVAWIRPDAMHVTLAFLGEQAPAALPRVEEAGRQASGVGAFDLRLGPAGVFPEHGPARVVWLGFSLGGDALAGLHARLRRALADRGVVLEARPFSAHVTLGRVRAGVRLRLPGIENAGMASRGATQPVRDFYLYQSELSPAGARHTVVAEFPLRGWEESRP